jgi:hypothetical protein
VLLERKGDTDKTERKEWEGLNVGDVLIDRDDNIKNNNYQTKQYIFHDGQPYFGVKIKFNVKKI